MARKHDYNYFDTFVSMVEFSCSAAKNLHETLTNYDAGKLPETLPAIHKIEHAADEKKHEMMKRLVTEFITPIEREDIISLAQEIDDVTDAIEDVLMKMYMFNVTEIRKEALAFSDLIVKCCVEMKKTMEEFCNFKKSSVIHQSIVQINHLEEEGDKLYMDAVRTLYTTCTDPVEIMTWTETFDRFEKCCDACEDVANDVESVIMKNS